MTTGMASSSQLLYNTDPSYVLAIKTKAAEDEKKAIYGLTILDNELFVVSSGSSDVEVYDSNKLNIRRGWNLKILKNPYDLQSCDKSKCLYILDMKSGDQSKEILRVDPNGKFINKWSIGSIMGRLSVTKESTAPSNVILNDYYRNKLIEYSPEGQKLHEINLSPDAGIRCPRHAIKLTSDLFVVSHGYYSGGGRGGGGDDDHQRVCLVDAYGKLQKSFGGKRGSAIGKLSDPLHMSIDRHGFILVADMSNSRVILLDSNLQFKREILSSHRHRLRKPMRILLDEFNGRLFVVDNGWIPDKGLFIDGRILVFAF